MAEMSPEPVPNKEESQVRAVSTDETLEESLVSVGSGSLGALIEMAHDAIIVRDMRGLVQFWNPGAQELYGWSGEQAKGKVLHNLLETIFPVSKEHVERALIDLGRWEGGPHPTSQRSITNRGGESEGSET